MDFKDMVRQFSTRVLERSGALKTEEATKLALVNPFIRLLGYDTENPNEVVPEYVCDIGLKKGEKIDYAIMQNNHPIILIESKKFGENLSLHDGQLLRYFHVSKAKFGVLTDDNIYKFYTDIEEPNKMDEKPFFEINLLEIDELHVEELKKFHKSYFDLEKIIGSASELKYAGELKAIIANEFNTPSAEFVKFFGKQVYNGQFTPKILEQFVHLVKRSIAQHISDLITFRLKSVIKVDDVENKDDAVKIDDAVLQKTEKEPSSEEMEAFYVVKSVLRNTVEVNRIIYRTAQAYIGIFVDNSRKPVCRLYLNNANNKKIGLIGEDKKEIKNSIVSVDDIYGFSTELTETVKSYL